MMLTFTRYNRLHAFRVDKGRINEILSQLRSEMHKVGYARQSTRRMKPVFDIIAPHFGNVNEVDIRYSDVPGFGSLPIWFNSADFVGISFHIYRG